MRRLTIVILLVALAGCATPMWVKEGATEQNLYTDSYECERDARMSGYFGGGIGAQINFNEFRKRCMIARGWRDATAQ